MLNSGNYGYDELHMQLEKEEKLFVWNFSWEFPGWSSRGMRNDHEDEWPIREMACIGRKYLGSCPKVDFTIAVLEKSVCNTGSFSGVSDLWPFDLVMWENCSD
jgi:hypothetical protein